jgi:hypothetical protein
VIVGRAFISKPFQMLLIPAADEERGKEIGLSISGFPPCGKSLTDLSPRVPGHFRGRL